MQHRALIMDGAAILRQYDVLFSLSSVHAIGGIAVCN